MRGVAVVLVGSPARSGYSSGAAMRLTGSALLLLLQPLSRAAAAVTTVSNTAIRRDQYGTPLNAHQGSMLQGHGPHAGTYYYYGGHTANCTHGAPPLHCQCANGTGQPHAGLFMWQSLAVYSSRDLQSWSFEREMFRRKPGDYGGGMNVYEPRVVSCRATQEYVMVVKAPGLEHSPFASRAGCQLTVMTSKDPTGPFVPQSCLNLTMRLFSDWSVFADPLSGNGYIIYNACGRAGSQGQAVCAQTKGQYIEQLTADFRRVATNTSAVTHIAEDLCKATGSDCEAPAMFVRGQQGNWGRMVW